MRRLGRGLIVATLAIGGLVAAPQSAGACPVPEDPSPTDPCAGELSCPQLPVVKDRPCPL